ncbi:MAG TPA: nucleotide exchange factor GrpE [Candidatus Paceibacterota bacterium]|nr:nucleotide exchange factor GrpE [Candidatus Paceibacterota bacterium]
MEKEEKQNKQNDEASEIGELKQKLAEAEKLKDEYLAGWQRQKADFLNYQKDIAKRTDEIVKFANEDLIGDLLIVLDSFDISVNSLRIEGLTETEKRIVQGLELIRGQLEDVLRKRGLEPIEALHQQFDPAWHEVIGEIETEGEEGEVAEELTRGYKLNGKLIRPSKVKIIKHK